jgi:hypothetical protein
MHGPQVSPIDDPATFLTILRRVVFDTAPYGGVLSVTLPHYAAADHLDRSLRLTSDRTPIPAGLISNFRSIDDEGAGRSLLDRLVYLQQDFLRYDGDMVVTLHEARDSDPLAGVIGNRTIYVEFGAIRAEGYRLP